MSVDDVKIPASVDFSDLDTDGILRLFAFRPFARAKHVICVLCASILPTESHSPTCGRCNRATEIYGVRVRYLVESIMPSCRCAFSNSLLDYRTDCMLRVRSTHAFNDGVHHRPYHP